jgi:AICAR transformylase/IMP cyclohydrolase PurH
MGRTTTSGPPSTSRKCKGQRVLRLPVVESAAHLEMDYRHISGGVLIQEQDQYAENTLAVYAANRHARDMPIVFTGVQRFRH